MDQPADRLRFSIEPVPREAGTGFQVKIYVNDLEMTSAGAGLGMDPYDVLVPVNRFVPDVAPHRIPVARCGCGEYGCGSTDVIIAADDLRVKWTWQFEAPMDRPVIFDRASYLETIERLGADTSWETPERAAGRLVLTNLNLAQLASKGLEVSWLANDWRSPEQFEVCLAFHREYQLFLRFPWNNDAIETLAGRVLSSLNDPAAPLNWMATWHRITPPRDQPPSIALPGWSREKI